MHGVNRWDRIRNDYFIEKVFLFFFSWNQRIPFLDESKGYWWKELRRRGRPLKALGEGTRKDMSLCSVIERQP